jgi:hypothetical protein
VDGMRTPPQTVGEHPPMMGFCSVPMRPVNHWVPLISPNSKTAITSMSPLQSVSPQPSSATRPIDRNGPSRCARRSDTPTHATARARKEPTGSTPKAGSCQTAKDDGGKPGVRFLARSKRGTRFRLRRSSVERNKEGDGFARLRWGETKEGDAVGGARLTIEIGAEFPIGITGSKTLATLS